MTEVTAPYNFVPLSDKVCLAKDLGLTDLPSQDVPVDGGMSGCIDVTMTCDTPILVNWSEQHTDRIKRFGRALPNGTPAIPGSTLRGMIRNVLEIATFGKMALVDDARTSVRDLNPTARLDYGSRVSEGSSSAGFAPKTKAGWLRLVGPEYLIEPCDFARVDHRDTLNALSVLDDENFRSRIDNARRQHDGSKTKVAWKEPGQSPRPTDTTVAEIIERIYLEGAGTSLRNKFWVEKTTQSHQHDGKILRYRKASKNQAILTGATSQLDGSLVFTGIPAPGKHMEFFFLAPTPGSTPSMKKVEKDVWQAFLDVHERQEKPSPTWIWRKPTLERGERIPVFYLEEIPGKVTHLGLAMMFKFPADRSIKEMIANSSPLHGSDEVDLAERIFGRLESANGKGDGWRSRVSFGWAEAVVGTYAEPENQDVSVILAKPKPGFAPAYVRQRDFKSVDGRELLDLGNKKVNYRSYMNWKAPGKMDPEKEEIRGWKRYPVGPERGVPMTPPTGEGVSRLRPLRRSKSNGPITFNFRLRYHNLHPVELGALLWAVTWDRVGTLRHAIGMGRPLGWGQVALSVDLKDAETDAIKVFKEKMEAWASSRKGLGSWAESPQLRQLRAMANPEKGKANKQLLSQMLLRPDHPDRRERNHFLNAKMAGRVLPEYADCLLSDLGRPTVSANPKRQDSDKPQTHAVPRGGPQGQHSRIAGPPKSENAGRKALADGSKCTILSEDRDGFMVKFDDGDIEFIRRDLVKFL